jgi:hypothetical protein
LAQPDGAPNGWRFFMFDVIFLALGFGSIALLCVYARALNRI